MRKDRSDDYDDDGDDDYDYGYRRFFPRSKPLQAKDGIKSQSRRGGFVENWWARRWIEVLESFNIASRLQRGRSYARAGQVLDIDVQKGSVRASVQGSRREPYSIAINLKVLSDQEWDRVATAMLARVIVAAKLLSGEMPKDLDLVFQAEGLSLFPAKLKEISTKCSCPDWSNPCKHIAAVYYLLGEEFDRDPFLILKLRGIDRDELMGRLSPSSDKAIPDEDATAVDSTDQLSSDPAIFWNGLPAEEIIGEIQPPRVNAPLVKRLGSPPFWRGATLFQEEMNSLYRTAGSRALDLLTR